MISGQRSEVPNRLREGWIGHRRQKIAIVNDPAGQLSVLIQGYVSLIGDNRPPEREDAAPRIVAPKLGAK